MDMSNSSIVYLGNGKILPPTFPVRRWPVELKERKPRSWPVKWDQAKIDEALRWGEALRLLVAVAREARACEFPGQRQNSSMSVYAASGARDLLQRVFPCRHTNFDSCFLQVDQAKVELSETPSWIVGVDEDCLVVVVGGLYFSCPVPPVGIDGQGAELYAALRDDEFEIGEALAVIAAMELGDDVGRA
jgi:hypothetical protein